MTGPKPATESRPTAATFAFFSAVLALLAFAPTNTAAQPLINVPNITVDEEDSPNYRNVQIPISFSGALNLRVQIVVSVRPRGSGRVRPVNRLRGIQPLTTSRTLNGRGVETVNIRVRGDLDRESDEVADVRLSFFHPLQGGRGGDVGVLTLRDDDHPDVTVSDSFWLEGGSVDLPDGGRHSVRLSKAINQSTELRVRTISNTALAGRDFVGVDRLITIPAGETEADVLVARIDDNVIDFESVKEYSVEATPVRANDIGNGGSPVGLGRVNDNEGQAAQEAIFQLANDPMPGPFLGGTAGSCRPDLPVDEPFNSNVDRRFRLTFGGVVTLPFEVRIITTDPGGVGSATAGQDYEAVDQIFTLQTDAASGFRSAVFTVRIRDDGVTEDNENIRIEALGSIIRNARPCGFQILTGAQSVIRINGNIL